jgi:ABC-type branched-subunit amino acid transport system ATPase component
MTMLRVEGASKAFGGIQALDSCSIELEQGTIGGLIGPNGSGKTTLFNVITGYANLDAGQVTFRGAAITNSSPAKVFSLGIGRTFQLTRVFSRLSVIENMHVAVQRGGLRGLIGRWSSSREQERALELLDFVGLAHLRDLSAGSLSYGQKKLLEFASILIAEPDVILLDEPAGGVNPSMIKYLADRIRRLNERGVTFLVVEHNMGFVMELCARVTVMHRGAAIARGTPDVVRNDPTVLEAYLGD